MDDKFFQNVKFSNDEKPPINLSLRQPKVHRRNKAGGAFWCDRCQRVIKGAMRTAHDQGRGSMPCTNPLHKP